MLEPRRLAARAVAQRMAHTLGERGGRAPSATACGWTRASRARRASRSSPRGSSTRCCRRTRRWRASRRCIFDEFHERSLQADLGLALALDARAHLSPDLRLLVMSATLDGDAVARLLGDAPLVSAPGRAFAVETRLHGPRRRRCLPRRARAPGEPPRSRVARLIAARAARGDTATSWSSCRARARSAACSRCSPADRAAARDVRVLPLFGDLRARSRMPHSRPRRAGHPQGGARHQHRRDQSHHPGRARRGRLGSGAPRRASIR